MTQATLPSAGADELRQGASRALARHAATLRYEALPPAVVALTKQCILDTLGVTVGASTLDPVADTILDFVTEMGGAPESSILGFGGKAPAAWAATTSAAWSPARPPTSSRWTRAGCPTPAPAATRWPRSSSPPGRSRWIR